MRIDPVFKELHSRSFCKTGQERCRKSCAPPGNWAKNWLFFGSQEEGEAGAILFSLVQTCRGLGINPREYLEDVMRRIMGHSNQISVMGLHTSTPSYSQICRRAQLLGRGIKRLAKRNITDLVIDSTGLKVYGEGEWKVHHHDSPFKAFMHLIKLLIQKDNTLIKL